MGIGDGLIKEREYGTEHCERDHVAAPHQQGAQRLHVHRPLQGGRTDGAEPRQGAPQVDDDSRPIAGAGTGDSVIVHVFGLGYMGIVNPKSQNEFLLMYDHNLQFIKLICPAGKSDYHVSMCDMLGKTVFETNHFLDGEIPTHDLMVGIYIISITDNEGNSTSLKLLKQ